ncbi:FIST signal transduction protein [Candidatus Zixiibacteriota bacterium]
MQIEQKIWSGDKGWIQGSPGDLHDAPQVVFVFGGRHALEEQRVLEEIRSAYDGANVFGCSTAGEICGTRVYDDSLVVTAVNFEHSEAKGTQINVGNDTAGYDAGKYLAQTLDKNGLVHAFVLSDGLQVNGSDLVKGLVEHLPGDVSVTGGLSGDGDRFQQTCVIWEGIPEDNSVAILGLYGDRLKVGYGSRGGWDSFGPERLITRSAGNVLYELDGRSALDLYKQYLGEHAQGLPATGLLFPLSLRGLGGETGVVRTILAVNEEEQSMTFAGDLPEGAYARLMKANFDRLIDGAEGAAKVCNQTLGSSPSELAILISCVGRKMVLKQRIEEEVESIQEVLGARSVLTGFYSYGEISPFAQKAKCELHNQTMTITTLSEK